MKMTLFKSTIGGAMALCLLTSPAAAVTNIFGEIASFEASVGTTIVDDYSNPSYVFIQSDSVMSAVLGETTYQSTGFSDLNIVANSGTTNANYCAGCNGSFRLGFETTSLSTGGSIFGVGFDIFTNSSSLPYDALITFGDGSTMLYDLGTGASFFGITSHLGIQSINFGPGGATSTSGSFGIDNLTIGASSAVPEPATWALMLLGFFGIGGMMRSSKRNQKVTVSYA